MTHVCPPGYCNCTRGFDNTTEEDGCLLEYENPFAICHYTRTGIIAATIVQINNYRYRMILCFSHTVLKPGLLCGECRPGYGVGLLTNECKKFTDVVPQFWLFPIYCMSMCMEVISCVTFNLIVSSQLLSSFLSLWSLSDLVFTYPPFSGDSSSTSRSHRLL